MNEQQQYDQDDLEHLKPDQFSLRGMLIAMTVVAAVLAVVRPVMRQLSTELIALLLGASLLGGILWWVRLYRRSRNLPQALAIAGEISMVVRRRRDWRAIVLTLVVGISLALYGGYGIHRFLSMGGGFASTIAAVFVFGGVFNVLNYVTMNVPPYCGFFENGFFAGPSYVPWENVHRDQWHYDRQGPCLEFRNSHWRLLKFRVHEQDCAAVEKVLLQVRPKYHGAVVRRAAQVLKDATEK